LSQGDVRVHQLTGYASGIGPNLIIKEAKIDPNIGPDNFLSITRRKGGSKGEY
jgi:hypothetical protein